MPQLGAWIVGGILSFTNLKAQCPPTIPNIQSYGTGAYSFKKIGEGCLPFTISVKNNMIGVQNVRTIFDYKGGPLSPELQSTDTLHSYSRPGVYTIVQLSEKNGRQLIACPTVYISDTIAPQVRLLPCGNSRVNVIFETPQKYTYDTYWIDWGDGNIEEVLPYQKSVPHVYSTATTYKISVWGMKKPGYCKSQEAIFTYAPTQLPQQQLPVLRSLSMGTSNSGTITVTNPLKVELHLLQQEDSGTWENSGLSFYKENESIQVRVDSLKTTCFQVQASDSCLAEYYKSGLLCTATLGLVGYDETNVLSWNSAMAGSAQKATLWKDGKFWKDITASGSTGSLTDPELTCSYNHCYQLVLSSPTGTFTSGSRCRLTPNNLCGVYTPIFIPEAFSPNGDGINDTFEVKGTILSTYELAVFNAWGTPVFSSQDPQIQWDGTFKGTPLPAGYYVFKVKLTSPATGQQVTRTGSVLLIR